MQKNEVGLISHTKMNSRYINELNIKPKTITLRRKYMGNLQNLGFDSGFLDITWKAWVRKGKNG